MKTSPLALLFAGFISPLVAADAPAPAAPTQVETKAYTDGGRVNVPVQRPYYPPTDFYDPSFSSRRFYNHHQFYNQVPSTITVQHRPMYYQPNPPALGETNFKSRNNASLDRLAPPLTLATHVYELFYTPLSTLLFTEDLSRRRREKLDEYQANRSTLLAEIRQQIDALQSADDATRERELSALASTQAGRLAALELAAEELRDNFVEGGFFESNSDWNRTREWRLGDNTRWESQIDEIKVMRGYAAYQAGLSPAQRRLLRETAMELEDSLATPTADISLTAQGPFFYFSPESSRITLPSERPVELSAKIDAYQELKTSLKRELRDALYAHDRALFNSKRVSTFKALAEQQAPRFTELETLAEEIRRGLALIPNPARPPALPLAKELRARITNYHREKAALQTTMLAKLSEVKNQLPDDRVEFNRIGGNNELVVVANRRTNAEKTAKRDAIVATLRTFNQDQNQRHAQLARERETLIRDVTAAAGEISGRSNTKSLNQLLQEFSLSLQKQEIWELYREYEIAVLQPGLSPAQRRILFGAALDKLNLPLNN